MSVDELSNYGMERMDDGEIRDFLASQTTGVLGLPDAGGPYLLPLAYGYGDDSRLYFMYVLGDSSRKEELSARAERATFLVYQVDSMFTWESVVLTGTLDELPDSEWGTALDTFTTGWRPRLFEKAELSRGTEIYEFDIIDQSGVKHLGLPEELTARD